MPSPIELMKPGEVPREDGWYVGVHRDEADLPSMLQLSKGVLWVDHSVTMDVEDFTFIARVYPDRIGEE